VQSGKIDREKGQNRSLKTEGGGASGPPRKAGPTRAAQKKLPKEGEEAGAGAEAVVGIAGEVAAEHFFFVEEAEDDQGDNSEETRERPPGAERKRSEKQHENGAEVHGMADEAVGPGGDDALPFFDLDGARGETVFLHDPKGDQVAGEDKELGKNLQPEQNGNPIQGSIRTQRRPTEPIE